MLKYDVSSMDKGTFMSRIEGKEPIKEADKKEIEEYLILTIKQDSTLQGREDEKAIGFLIGKLKQKYHMDSKEAKEIIEKTIKTQKVN
jgi:hypothetical protein